ncbi:hypothetical protein PSN45_003887 [Yamadazyma tenuis]|uniref:Protein transport protein SEC23 n=1 Tax=Candida tenuis (strain ATCC 10573 / BCRC 21748 / CBS 615 / JCM 9827 / NBRC 10315 / NRRL Y-1498 / VKM Y-70) TaxID=590646 RepID=G3B505_CANTC|nr:vWA-like protein [Yamadazyma tenuis ATCC 10573]EGV64030.1 vWA-like protein [Yamadazyma tenuis ATCC 10573]WEJ96348.1 hypothetical protein PSN45_003887 [Yamadazyma tenuis]
MKQEYTTSYIADGVQFNWNVFPSTRLEAKQLSSPIGCLYTPLHKRSHNLLAIPSTDEHAIKCDACECVINPFVKIDRANKMWWCPYCEGKSYLPEAYVLPESSSSESWPVELRQSSSTIDYKLPNDVAIASEYHPNYVFVIDGYQHVDEIDKQQTSFTSMKKSVCEAIESLPNGAYVAIVSYDENVYLHKPLEGATVAITDDDVLGTNNELDQSVKRKKVSLFNPTAIGKVLGKLGLANSTLGWGLKACDLIERSFLVQLTNSNKAVVSNYIKSIKPKFTDSYKPPRATGLALYTVSVVLSRASYKGFIGKVILFAGGPCTSFPGNIIDTSHSKNLRSHHDIANLNVAEFVPSSKFYKTLALVGSGLSFEAAHSCISKSSKKESEFELDINQPKWSFDLYSGSLDQVGIYEMKDLSSHTMGSIYLFDSFDNRQFHTELMNSFRASKVYNSTLTVRTSPGLKVSRLIGPGHCLPSSYQAEKYYTLHHEKISDHLSSFDSSSKKKNFTNRWCFNELTPHNSCAIIFDPETVGSTTSLSEGGIKEMFIQFQLKYLDPIENVWKLRVTNITKKTTLYYLAANKVKMSNNTYKLVNTKSSIIKEEKLLESFDQFAFIVIFTRLILDKIDSILGFEEFDSVIGSIDKVLIRLLHYFGGISLNQAYLSGSNPYSNLLDDIVQKYTINENFKELPSLTYYLRRNPQLIRIFNSSPDETAFYHHWFMNVESDISLTMIKPKMYSLFEGNISEISLDAQNVLSAPPDCFIVMDSVFSIIIYKNDLSLRLHHSSNLHLIDDNHDSIEEVMTFIKTLGDRRLQPKYVITQKNHSQSRFLLARLNPAEDIESKLEGISINEPKGFLAKLFGSKGQSQQRSYSSLLTDDISLNEYYTGLIETIKKFSDDQDS